MDTLAAPARLTLGTGQVYEGIATLRGSDPDTLAPDWQGTLSVRNWVALPWPAPEVGSVGVLAILRTGSSSRCTIVKRAHPITRNRQTMQLTLRYVP